ncbi:MAG: hypothetical protein ACJ8I9_03095 [Chthoniobacterales bacterium]
MFEVITQTQPDDYQSLAILKDSYTKLGRPEDALKTSRRLSEAYFNVGSYSLAMQECEAVLKQQPNSPEMLAMLGEIDSRLNVTRMPVAAGGVNGGLTVNSADGGLIRGSNGASDGSLINIHSRNGHSLSSDRGDEQLAKFLVMQQLFNEEEVAAAMETVRVANENLDGQTLAASLVDKLCQQDDGKTEAVISALIDRTKFAYVPLEYYDLDRQTVRMLPDELTLGRLFVPFDLISRTIMVACCNPYDAAGREAVQQSLDYTVAWYLARPSAVLRALQESYRIEAKA